jgi:hypothetical protein
LVPDLTTAPPALCAPRPAVGVVSTPSGPGRLQVTVTANTSAGTPSNQLVALRFTSTTNATVDVAGQAAQSGSFAISLPAGTMQTTFTVNRVTAGQPTVVSFVAVDGCGDWPTFVGSGPSPS